MAKSSVAFNVIFGAKTDNLQKALKTIDGQLNRSAKRFKSIGATMSRNLTAPLGLIGASSFKVAADFEASMSKVKAISGATSQEFKTLEADARRLGSATRFSATEVSGLQTEYAKLGFKPDEIVNATEATLALAQASGSDLGAAAEVAGATLRGFGLDASETGRVTDVMASAFSSSALDLDSFRDSMKFVAPVAASAGVSLEEASGMLATLANNGIKGSQAGTALRRILSTMAADGSSFEQAFQKSAKSVITLGDAKDEVGRSAQSAFLVLQKGQKDVKDLTKNFNEAEGSAKEMADVMGNNAEGAIKRMQSAVEGAQITIGNALAPTILSIIGKVEKAAAAFSNMTQGQQQLIIGVAGSAAALGPLSSGIGSVIGGFKNAVPVIRKFSAFMAANPYVAAAAAIIAIGTAIYKLTKRTDEFEVTRQQLDKANKKAREGYATEAAEVQKLAKLYKLAGDDQERRADILKRIKKIDENHFKDLDAEKTTYEELSGKVAVYTKELRKAAIAKAFGEQLTEVEAQRLIIADKLTDAQDKLAIAQERMVTATKASTGSMKDGMNMSLTATRSYDRAKKAVEDLEAEQRGLAEASDQLATKIAKANEELNDTPDGKEVKVETKPDPVKVEVTPKTHVVKAKATFETDETELDKVFATLSQESAEIAGVFALDGDEIAQTEALAGAYRAAAEKAAALGEVDIALGLQSEADAAAQLAASMERVATAGSRADQVLADLEVPASAGTGVNALLGGLDNFNTTSQQTQEQSEQVKESLFNLDQVGQQFGANLSNAFNSIRQANADLTQQVEDGAITQEEANKRSAENTKKALKAAALQTIGSMLAEATAIAIKNAFQTASASGPAAAIVGPILAGGAAAAVAGLFSSKVPQLAEGGITTKETLAIVGDNPSGREAIVPLEKLSGLMETAITPLLQPLTTPTPPSLPSFEPQQATNTNLSGRLEGGDILLSSERSARARRRVRNF